MRWWRSVPDQARTPDWLTARPYAHRGLHGGGIVENSRSAFEAAIAKGFGIELDARPASCGTPFVFHDAMLERLCGLEGRFGSLDRDVIGNLRLKESGETIPVLADTLSLIASRVPVLVEVKSEPALDRRFLGRLVHALRRYRGPLAVMSFDPRVARWIAEHAPQLIRGLVMSEEGKGKFKGLIERRLAVRLAQPDFLAYDIRSLPSPFAAAMRRRGLAVLTWTVRSASQAHTARMHADQIIHEWDGAG
jgi:glycerophosphoryl diester phosphodiesterase